MAARCSSRLLSLQQIRKYDKVIGVLAEDAEAARITISHKGAVG
jgi:hypothetical protein